MLILIVYLGTSKLAWVAGLQALVGRVLRDLIDSTDL